MIRIRYEAPTPMDLIHLVLTFRDSSGQEYTTQSSRWPLSAAIETAMEFYPRHMGPIVSIEIAGL